MNTTSKQRISKNLSAKTEVDVGRRKNQSFTYVKLVVNIIRNAKVTLHLQNLHCTQDQTDI